MQADQLQKVASDLRRSAAQAAAARDRAELLSLADQYEGVARELAPGQPFSCSILLPA